MRWMNRLCWWLRCMALTDDITSPVRTDSGPADSPRPAGFGSPVLAQSRPRRSLPKPGDILPGQRVAYWPGGLPCVQRLDQRPILSILQRGDVSSLGILSASSQGGSSPQLQVARFEHTLLYLTTGRGFLHAAPRRVGSNLGHGQETSSGQPALIRTGIRAISQPTPSGRGRPGPGPATACR